MLYYLRSLSLLFYPAIMCILCKLSDTGASVTAKLQKDNLTQLELLLLSTMTSRQISFTTQEKILFISKPSCANCWYLFLKNEMFSLPVLEYAKRLQRTHNVVCIDCRFLTQVYTQTSTITSALLSYSHSSLSSF